MVHVDFGRESFLQPSLYPISVGERRVVSNTTNIEDTRRFSRYMILYKFFMGDHWSDLRIPKQHDDDIVTANFCEPFVNKGAAFLMNRGWSIKDEDDDFSEETLPFLNQVWKDNNKELICYETAQLGGCLGDFCWVVMRDNQGDYQILNIPPLFVHPLYHPANNKRLLRVTIEYPLYTISSGQGDEAKQTVLTMIIDELKIQQFVDGNLVFSQEHGLGELPVVIGKNKPIPGATYGSSDLASVLPLQRLYNFKLRDISDIINYHAAPVTIIKGAKLRNLERGAKKAWGIPKDADVYNLELKSDLQAAAAHLQHLKELMHLVVGIPEVALGKEMNVSNTSA